MHLSLSLVLCRIVSEELEGVSRCFSPLWLLNHTPPIASPGHLSLTLFYFILTSVHALNANTGCPCPHIWCAGEIGGQVDQGEAGGGGTWIESIAGLNVLWRSEPCSFWLSVHKACVVSGPASVRTRTFANQEIHRRNKKKNPKNKTENQITRTPEKKKSTRIKFLSNPIKA